MKALDQEICVSLEEWTWQRWGTTRPEEDWEGALQALQPSCWTKSPHRAWVRNEDSHDRTLAEAREAYWRALEAAHLLEQNMERLNWAASKAKSAGCWCSYSHGCSRMQSQGRHPQSPGPTRLRRHVTFQNQEEMSSREGPSMEPLGQVTGEREVEESDLGPLPPCARAWALPGGTNTHAGCQG